MVNITLTERSRDSCSRCIEVMQCGGQPETYGPLRIARLLSVNELILTQRQCHSSNP